MYVLLECVCVYFQDREMKELRSSDKKKIVCRITTAVHVSSIADTQSIAAGTSTAIARRKRTFRQGKER